MSGQSDPKGEVAKRFCGAWRYVGARIDGKPRSGLGANPKGIICYDSSGAMVVQVAPDRERGKAGSAPTPEEARAALAKDNTDGRLISPDDVAAKVLWLCSPAANAVNGEAIVIAGGAA